MDSSSHPCKYFFFFEGWGGVGIRVVKHQSNIKNTFWGKHPVIRTGAMEHNPMADSFLMRRGEAGWSTRLGNRDVTVKKRGRRRGREAEGRRQTAYSQEATCLCSSSSRTYYSWVTQHYLLSNKQQVSLFAQRTVVSLVSAWHRG